MLKLVSEVVRTCPKCSKWHRPLNRPTLRIELVGHFNFQIEIDLFYLWDLVFLLMMDSPTRYKACALLPDRTAEAIMKGMHRRWISIFGPPSVCISDQEASISGDDVGVNFERLCILRNPKGSDPQGKHTGTGSIATCGPYQDDNVEAAR